MITITGPYHTSSGALVNGFVRFRPYPYSDNQGTGKVISTTLVDGREKTVEFADGEPVDTLMLYQGTYEVVAPLTKTQRIAVPAGTATKAIAELITSGAPNPPSIEVGIPSGGTDGQVLKKQSGEDFDADWEDEAGASVWGGITGTLADQADLQAALDAKAATAIPVSSLPASPVVGQIYRLTDADSAYLAPAGLYIASSSGWTCLAATTRWADYSWTSTAITVVPNTRHIVAISSPKTGWSVTFTSPGVVIMVVSNLSENVIEVPTINGSTPQVLFADGWADASAAYTTLYLEWDGSSSWVAAKEIAV